MRVDDDAFTLGASLTLTELERRLDGAIPLFDQVFPQFASRLIRNGATLGGNLGTASPIGDFPPALLVHGTNDDDVPYEQSAAMARELARHKVPHELITVRGAGHGLAGGDPKEVNRGHEKALKFLRGRLR